MSSMTDNNPDHQDQTQARDYALEKGLPTVNINGAKMIYRLCMLTRHPVIFVGHSGIGKTALLNQEAEAHNLNKQYFHLSYTRPSDIKGTMYPRNDGTFEYVGNRNVPTTKNDHITGPTMLMMDEINRAKDAVLDAAMPMLLKRKVGYHNLRENVMIAATMNPPGGRYEVNEKLTDDPAMRRRACQVYVEFDARLASKYARGENDTLDEFPKAEMDIEFIKSLANDKWAAPVRNFTATHPERFLDEDARRAGKLYPSPASWQRVSDTIKAINYMGWNWTEDLEDALYAKIAGHIGRSAANEFMRFMDDPKDYIDPEEVIQEYANNPDVQNQVQNTMHNGGMRVKILLDSIANRLFEMDNPQLYVQNIGSLLGDLSTKNANALIEQMSDGGEREREHRGFFRSLQRTDGYSEYEKKKKRDRNEMEAFSKDVMSRKDPDGDLSSLGNM